MVDDVPVFESQAICELLDEVGPPPRLMPEDPIERARDRGWFAFAEDILNAQYRLQIAADRPAFDKAVADLDAALTRFEAEMKGREFFPETAARSVWRMSLSPPCARIDFLERAGAYRVPGGLPGAKAWMRRIQARPSVQGSLPTDFDELSTEAMRAKGRAR